MAHIAQIKSTEAGTMAAMGKFAQLGVRPSRWASKYCIRIRILSDQSVGIGILFQGFSALLTNSTVVPLQDFLFFYFFSLGSNGSPSSRSLSFCTFQILI